MKRLLLPLLAALALPTAVNANWFSRDIVIKSNIGSKFIIKKATVSIEENYYKSNYVERWKEVKQKQYQKRIREIEMKENRALKNYRLPTGDEKDTYLDIFENTKKEIRQADLINKRFIDGGREGKHAVIISYRVIYEDINGYKEADYSRSSVFCINPKLRAERRNNWKKIKGYSYSYMNRSSSIRDYWIKKAICDKYAKF